MTAISRNYAFLTERQAAFFFLDLDRLARLLLTNDVATELHGLFTPAENALLEHFSFSKRRLEWIGGRLAAKYCLRQVAPDLGLEPEQAVHLSILPDSYGRPLVLDAERKALPVRLSLSHSHSYAAALASMEANCGIDIQKKTKNLKMVRERFVLPQEELIVSTIDDELRALAIFWTSKEAIKKSLLPTEPRFFESVRIENICPEQNRPAWRVFCKVARDGEETAALVRVTEHQDYCLACTVGEEHA